jgi:hypothetical protein
MGQRRAGIYSRSYYGVGYVIVGFLTWNIQESKREVRHVNRMLRSGASRTGLKDGVV